MYYRNFIDSKCKCLEEKKIFLRILKDDKNIKRYEIKGYDELFRAYQEFTKIRIYVINYLKKTFNLLFLSFLVYRLNINHKSFYSYGDKYYE